VAEGRVTGIDLAAAERELTAAARGHGAALGAQRPLLKTFQDGLRRFYRAGGHTGKSVR